MIVNMHVYISYIMELVTFNETDMMFSQTKRINIQRSSYDDF